MTWRHKPAKPKPAYVHHPRQRKPPKPKASASGRPSHGKSGYAAKKPVKPKKMAMHRARISKMRW